MKKQKKIKGILKEEKEFLKYLYKNYANENKRKKGVLIDKFGKEKYDRIYHLLMGKEISILKELYITPEGLRKLEEIEREERKRMASIGMLIVTGFLVILTAFYAIQTHNLNKTSFQVFETENRPYLRIENFSLIGNEFELIVSNQGKLPGQVKRVIFEQGENRDLNNVNRIIFSHEEIVFRFSPNFNMEDHKLMEIKVEYNGLGELRNNEYYTTSNTIKINKNVILSNEEYI